LEIDEMKKEIDELKVKKKDLNGGEDE